VSAQASSSKSLVEDRDGDAVGRQSLADRETDAGRAAGDDGDPRRPRRHWIASFPASVVRCVGRERSREERVEREIG